MSFIRINTHELRKKLKEFGYTNKHLSTSTTMENCPLLSVYHDGYYQELFLALAALCDDIEVKKNGVKENLDGEVL
jgi:hypothetical protein